MLPFQTNVHKSFQEVQTNLITQITLAVYNQRNLWLIKAARSFSNRKLCQKKHLYLEGNLVQKRSPRSNLLTWSKGPPSGPPFSKQLPQLKWLIRLALF